MRINYRFLAVCLGLAAPILVTSNAPAADNDLRGRSGAIYNAAVNTSRTTASSTTTNGTDITSAATESGSSTRMPTMATLPGSIGLSTANINSGSSGEDKEDTTIDNCMSRLRACVTGGALPNGINDMFNSDLRNSIMNGMGLCSAQVDYCIANAKRDGKLLYSSASDVWLDFNSRVVQPEYYAFVLRKTGLTPNQAENTCWLLDKNTYGTSFAAVSNSGSVTNEYDQTVGAYNSQVNNSLAKDRPQGMQTNKDNAGVDGQRGHYARWDATAGDCLVRVAAYNKDKQITNSWLFGALGDDKSAEVWKSAGSSFVCNKDLFGFALRQDTKTVALLGVGGGATVGAGIGAIAGAAKKHDFDCTDEKSRNTLLEAIRKTNKVGVLNKYLGEVDSTTDTSADQSSNESIVAISVSANTINDSVCNSIVDLYDKYEEGKDMKDPGCLPSKKSGYSNLNLTVNGTTTKTSSNADEDWPAGYDENGCPLFPSMNASRTDWTGVYQCTGGEGCVIWSAYKTELNELSGVFASLESVLSGTKSKAGAGAAIGAASGAAAGGLATAITAFVEKNNISCHIGDGLEKIAMGKNGKIESLKDYYVKWNLALPDVIRPTAQVTDCTSWRNACGTINDITDCANAQVNYKPANSMEIQLVDGACVASGSVCIENHTVATSYGACE